MKLFKADNVAAVENLKHHILAGCLPEISPGGRTNQNEQLHEHIFYKEAKLEFYLHMHC